jgi:hypothetical protein
MNAPLERLTVDLLDEYYAAREEADRMTELCANAQTMVEELLEEVAQLKSDRVELKRQIAVLRNAIVGNCHEDA